MVYWLIQQEVAGSWCQCRRVSMVPAAELAESGGAAVLPAVANGPASGFDGE
jgi:hypothetical protein